ncbi:hypothetical protein [Flavobacterium sp. 3HN19-14]|uniref:hypothetical protein n=1 Tax=Flavobacterium sp. 3HN19-14 TaxID=3448133 RepID=UPI003EE1CAF8
MKQFNKAWLFLLALPLSMGAQELKGDSPIPFDPNVRNWKIIKRIDLLHPKEWKT